MEPKEKTSVLLTIYQVIRDNQQFYMRQQWAVIYYAILLYAAIFASYRYLHNYEFYMYIFGGIVCVLSTIIVCFHEISLCETRKTERKIENEIPLIYLMTEPKISKNDIEKYLKYSIKI